MWFTLDNGTVTTTNEYISYTPGTNVSISQTVWDEVGNGTVTITFYASDDLGYVGSYSIDVRKDLAPPTFSVTDPLTDSTKAISDRNYVLSLGSGIVGVWYSIEDGENHYVTSVIGNFDKTDWEEAWNATPYGEYFTITFNAIDDLGNVASVEIRIYTDKPKPKIPFGNSFMIFGLVAIVAISILVKRKIGKK